MQKLDIGKLRHDLVPELSTTERERYGVFIRLDRNRLGIFDRDILKPALQEWLGERVVAALIRRGCDYQRSLEEIASDRLRGQVHTLLDYWEQDRHRFRCPREATRSAYRRYAIYHRQRSGGLGILPAIPLGLLEQCIRLLHD